MDSKSIKAPSEEDTLVLFSALDILRPQITSAESHIKYLKSPIARIDDRFPDPTRDRRTLYQAEKDLRDASVLYQTIMKYWLNPTKQNLKNAWNAAELVLDIAEDNLDMLI